MPLPKAQVKGFIDELHKIGDKSVAQQLNKLIFQEQPAEPGTFVDETNPAKVAPNPIGGADLGSGQSSDVVGNSRVVSPAVGPGGV